MSTRIAFATTDGVTVDEHFGHAKYWDVYDIDLDKVDLVETRLCRPGCSCHDTKVFSEMLDVLDDCDVLFVAMIGEGAAGYVINRGKRVFQAAGDIYQIMKSLIDNNTLEGIRKKAS